MKICHISDSHLGAGENYPKRAQSGLTLRQEDIINSFKEAIDLIINIKPDICIHSGDLFDAVRPSNRIMAIAGEQLYRLASANNIPTVIISGNHDAPKQLHIGAALDIFNHIDNLYVSAGAGLKTFTIKDAKIFALPHCLTTEIQKQELLKCMPDSKYKYNLLMMHGVAAGMPEFSMADLGEQEIPVEIMNQFDYTALGHYHNYSQVGKRAYYSGSTERLSQGEREHAKGFIVVGLEPFKVGFQQVHCREMVDLPSIDAKGKRGDQLAQVIKEKIEQVGSSDKIVRLKITGATEETLRTMPVDVISSLKKESFALNITFEKEKSKEQEVKFGRSAIGRLDASFIKYLETVELEGFDKERLIEEATKYLNL